MKTGTIRIFASATALTALFMLPDGALAQNRLENRLVVDTAASKAEKEREIVVIVEQTFGRNAVVNTGTGLSPEMDDKIVPGAPLPAGAPVRPLPEQLQGKLPQITPGARWVGIGSHLVELGEGDVMTSVIYHSLPR